MDKSLIAKDTSIEAFIEAVASMENRGGSSKPQPLYIRLNGNSGTYSQRVYDPNTKENLVVDFGESPFTSWNGTILLTKWFAKWKYKGTPDGIVLRTREFSDFRNERIELLKIDYNAPAEKRTVVEAVFNDYQRFKEDNTTVERITGMRKASFDLWVALYVFDHRLNQVVKYCFKGDTRTAYFDYMRDYSVKHNVQSMIQVQTKFGSVQKEMPKSATDTEVKTYFAGTFETVSVNTNDEMHKIKDAFIGLGEWMKSFESQPESDQPIVIDLAHESRIEEEEIKLEDIPF